MADTITIEECITRLDAIRHEIVTDSRDHFALSAGIAALYEMENGAPAVNRWIPYSEKRPDLWGEYLTYNAENGAMYVLSFSTADNTFGIYDGNVTHWMPLPEPPKE